MHRGLANKMKSCSSSERVQAGVGHQGRGYQVPVACGPDEERELETVFYRHRTAPRQNNSRMNQTSVLFS